MGRKRVYDEGAVTTTVRIGVSNWNWLKSQKVQTTAWVNAQISKARLDAETAEAAKAWLADHPSGLKGFREGPSRPSSKGG